MAGWRHWWAWLAHLHSTSTHMTDTHPLPAPTGCKRQRQTRLVCASWLAHAMTQQTILPCSASCSHTSTMRRSQASGCSTLLGCWVVMGFGQTLVKLRIGMHGAAMLCSAGGACSQPSTAAAPSSQQPARRQLLWCITKHVGMQPAPASCALTARTGLAPTRPAKTFYLAPARPAKNFYLAPARPLGACACAQAPSP